jgi:hypothetical protein
MALPVSTKPFGSRWMVSASQSVKGVAPIMTNRAPAGRGFGRTSESVAQGQALQAARSMGAGDFGLEPDVDVLGTADVADQVVTHPLGEVCAAHGQGDLAGVLAEVDGGMPAEFAPSAMNTGWPASRALRRSRRRGTPADLALARWTGRTSKPSRAGLVPGRLLDRGRAGKRLLTTARRRDHLPCFYLGLTEIMNGVELSGTTAAPDPGGIRICWSGGPVSRANLYDDDDARPDAVTAPPAPCDPGDLWLARVDAADVTFPRAGRPGHGCTAVMRRQPPRIGDGRVEDGHAGAFEIICCNCGGNPYLDYCQLSPRLQQIRGPYAIAAGLAAYEEHLGLTTARRRS